MRYPITSPVTVELGHGNIGLYAPHHGLPWAVLASIKVTFHFGSRRSRYKVLKVRVQLGGKEPVGHQLTDAYGAARSMLASELFAHGVSGISESDIHLHDCEVSKFQPDTLPDGGWPF